mmetsp:Transcript_5687/g.12490  ORF Transcript_5687/g.12490 Transcript_5687/m.12490 type:complete len:618 (-) Transcript_5687:93-1946(-)
MIMAEDATNVGLSNHCNDHQPEKATGPSKKRNSNDDRSNINNQKQQSNKRRKKNKNKNKNKKVPKNNHTKHNKKWNNWIENCSESIDRVPSNCVAPLLCIVTRVEIEEEPLIPKGVSSHEKGDDDEGKSEQGKGEDASAGDCDHFVKKEDKGEDVLGSSTVHCYHHQAAAALPDADVTISAKNNTIYEETPNMAGPSFSFITQYAKGKNSWKIPATTQINGEEKKLFISVIRHASATGPTKWLQRRKKVGRKHSSDVHHHLPGGDNGDGIQNPYPSSAVPDKFWAQRKRLFSRYDEGIQIGGENDPEMWYSVTPESIANHVAERMMGMIRGQSSRGGGPQSPVDGNSNRQGSIVIIDAFCGCGGNSIAFARLNDCTEKRRGNEEHRQQPQDASPPVKVIAVDNNLPRLIMAANNAMIYGINKEDIIFVHADTVEVLNCYSKGARIVHNESINEKNRLRYNSSYALGFTLGGLELLPDNVDGIFLSPPWGGMDYRNEGGKAGFDPVSSITIESTFEETPQKHDSAVSEEIAETSVTTNGGELLSIAAKAVLNTSKNRGDGDGTIAYFLPRNTSGISMGQIAIASGIEEGCFEMEQNVVNGKVKTITAYFGRSTKCLLK